jgi:hypothetical protein
MGSSLRHLRHVAGFSRFYRFARSSSAAPLALLTLVAAPLGGCNNGLPNDPAAVEQDASALGSGERIRDVMNPTLRTHPASGALVSISGASYLTTDTFDETHDGKSKGTVYLQDVPPNANAILPYSGASLFSPTYLPANLRPAPGDVLDLVGTFSFSASLGAAVFPAGSGLVQISKPVVQPRFEYQLPAPTVIAVSDLGDFNKGLQWNAMLVTIENVTIPDNLSNDGKGRFTAHASSDVSATGPTIANELFDLETWNSAQATPPIAAGQTVKSITGIVTWFFNYHLCPRSPADIVVQ